VSIKVAVAACLALAGLSLLLPGAPSYDPLAWVIWGRELVELNLKTTGGPSWKPLPVGFTTLFSLFGTVAPWLWLVLARASALLGLVFAYRIASRLAGAAAGVLAAAALVVSRGWFWSDWIGYSEGLLLALVLWAVDRHLEGRRRQALVLGFLACLLRPEVWPFVAAYGIWLWLRQPATRRLSMALAVAIPVLWLVPELIGSGDAFRASDRARELTAGSHVPGLAAHPALAVLTDGRTALLFPALVGFALGMARWRPRPGVERVTLALGLGTLAWLGVVAAMAQAGYSGNPRYLIAPSGLACVVAGVGWASAGRALLARMRLPAVLIGSATVIAVAAASLPWTFERAEALRAAGPGVAHEAHLQHTLPDAIRLGGGQRRLLACGTPVTQLYAVPRVAWWMHVHVGDVGFVAPRSGLVFQARRRTGAPWLPPTGPGYQVVAQTGPWRVVDSCTRRPPP
jgi:hypothetical protein